MKILVTGAAGFIGSALALSLLEQDHTIIGVDNHDDYYDPKLKEDRVSRCFIYKKYAHIRENICEAEKLDEIFTEFKPEYVVHLAAQAGVRYSLENPKAYINSNIVGFANILEQCKKDSIKHLIYASSSSVYGGNTKLPFSEHDNINHPLSLYAATKKANEMMAHSYSHLYNMPTTGLRFFTVYGPWGRPDMALFKFTKAILNNETIDVFNNGKHTRDFTYIDDIVAGITNVIEAPATKNSDWDSNNPDPASSNAPWRIYNIGNNNPINLMEYIQSIEKFLGREANKNFLPLQPGDVPDTFADVSDLVNDHGYEPKTTVNEGINKFVDWYLEYYNN
ncbi:MAG: NAD-dependent epimerase [Pseudomonadota bacterium]